MSNRNFTNDGSAKIPPVLWFTMIVTVLVVIHSILNPTFNKVVEPDNIVQYSSTIYHHFTVYQDRIDGTLFVIEIDVDDSIPVSCDGSLKDTDEEDENGHNCVIISEDGILELINLYNLPFSNVKGE